MFPTLATVPVRTMRWHDGIQNGPWCWVDATRCPPPLVDATVCPLEAMTSGRRSSSP
jgi:hypothetical protein